MTDDIYDDLLKALKQAGDRLAGQLKTLKATPPEELTPALLTEFRTLITDACDRVEELISSLIAALASSPRQAPHQTAVRDFTVAGVYSEEADRVR